MKCIAMPCFLINIDAPHIAHNLLFLKIRSLDCTIIWNKTVSKPWFINQIRQAIKRSQLDLQLIGGGETE